MENTPRKPGTPMHSNSQNITKDKIKRFLPKGSAHQVTDEIMKALHQMEDDTGIIQSYMEESILSHMTVFNESKVDLIDYINATKYVVLTADMTNRKAWEIVFPASIKRLEEKIARLEAEEVGSSKKVNIDSNVSNYNKSDIVVALKTRTALHASIVYAPAFAEAMQVKQNLMRGIGANSYDRVSPTVQLAAAIAITDKTQMPEDNNIEIKVGITDDAKSVQQNLADQIAASVALTRSQLASGVPLDKAQQIGLITDAELVDE